MPKAVEASDLSDMWAGIKERYYIKNINVIFHPFAEKHPVERFASKLAPGFVSRTQSVKGFGFCKGPKFAISH